MLVHHWQHKARQRQTEQESSVMCLGYRQGTEGELQLEREAKASIPWLVFRKEDGLLRH